MPGTPSPPPAFPGVVPHSLLDTVGILALYLQDRHGWRAGKVQMGLDCSIVLLALWSVEPTRVALSVVGAAALNLVLAMNHRPGRYMVG